MWVTTEKSFFPCTWKICQTRLTQRFVMCHMYEKLQKCWGWRQVLACEVPTTISKAMACSIVQPVRLWGGRISAIFGNQVSLRDHYHERVEVYFTTLQWQNNGRQNGLISRMLFSELHKVIGNEVTFVSLKGGDRPNRPPWILPCEKVCLNELMFYASLLISLQLCLKI